MFNRLTIIVIALVFVGCANQNNEKYVASNAPAIQKEDKDDKLDVESQKPYKTPKEKAFEDAKKLGEQGNAVDQINLAVMYEDGNGVPKDFEQALYWYTKAAEQGNSDAQYYIGFFYYEGDGVPQDSEKGLYWLTKAAEQGYVEAQKKLGLIYADSNDVPQDWDKAIYYFTKAAEQGDADAQNLVGVLYYKGDVVPKDIDKGMYWISRAAAQGFEAAKDFITLKVIKEKAEQGDPEAQYDLGVMYYYGKRVSKNLRQAVYWTTKAAEQGYPDAQYNLGILYLEGDGVPQDSEQALYWFFKSAEQGFPDAQRNLGVSYLRGDIIPQNDKQGVYWLTKAAMQGNAPAQYSLGYSYMNGRGVPQNAKLAYAWFNLSASQGNENGVKGRNLMANNLSAYQLSQAQDLTVELQQEIEQYNESQKSEDSKLKTDIKISSSGTGFIITNGGYVITCNHVIKNENDIRIVFNGNELSAKLVLTDPNNDLALLKIEGSFPAIAFSKNRSAKMGEKVFTVGYPNPSIQGINLKYNSGNISSLTGFQDDVRLYQISVPVQPGNSGGPLLDENGNILGVIVSQLDAKTAFALTGTLPQNVNYAIKSIYAQAMLDTLPGISEKLVNPVKNNSNVIDKAKQSTVIVLCYSP